MSDAKTVDWDKVEFSTPCLVWNEGEKPVIRDYCGMCYGQPVFNEGFWANGLPVMMAFEEMARNTEEARSACGAALTSLRKWQDVSLLMDAALARLSGSEVRKELQNPDMAMALDACRALRAHRVIQ